MRFVFIAFLSAALAEPVWADHPLATEADASAPRLGALGGDVNLMWWSIDGGGGSSSGGGFTLEGAVGQPDVGLISNCTKVIDGGFQSRSVDLGGVFCSGFENGDFSAWSSHVGGNP
jgi:hypothetical protein